MNEIRSRDHAKVGQHQFVAVLDRNEYHPEEHYSEIDTVTSEVFSTRQEAQDWGRAQLETHPPGKDVVHYVEVIEVVWKSIDFRYGDDRVLDAEAHTLNTQSGYYDNDGAIDWDEPEAQR